jgi:hypothetical protein
MTSIFYETVICRFVETMANAIVFIDVSVY